ncbi:hypothetical protein BBBOND_0203360 [Babesia bigemina]|uniref:Uncharacterized protein n=1 Tax=Babesia bigemina TaxID=5866 RepID=A0A061D8D7_BABBI|nr:hypothetical protein BBBOND_0203360 [Babesia bigemina]CDR95179.1 hypothetical protein BBBOND_0203360 [Babesia bigemina]|eukprot:XP_012767365.1 hypothetical protein BBBOND_0203360 [Babesia bigemina]
MVYTSLTEAPHNLKEGIDWLMAVKGDDAGHNLAAMGAAIHKFLVDKPVGYTEVAALEKVKRISKEFLQQEEVTKVPYVNKLLEKFDKPVNKNPDWIARTFTLEACDYKNVVKTGGVEPKEISQDVADIVGACEKFLGNIKASDHYESAYSSEATWEASCSKKPEDCAAVFVGIAPMVNAGIRSLRFASHSEAYNWLPFIKTVNLRNVLKALGYDESDSRYKLGAKVVFKALQGVSYRMLQTLYELSGYWAFYESSTTDVDAEPSVEGEGEQSLIPEAEPSVEGEGEQSVIPEAEPSVEGEGEQSVIPEAEPSVDGEGEQSVIPEAEPSVEGEGEQSVIPEAEPSVEPAGEEPVIPEAEPSVEPVKPEVDDIEKPVKVAKAAKVARSVKAAKKAAKKVSKKARQKKEKKQKKQQESAEQ